MSRLLALAWVAAAWMALGTAPAAATAPVPFNMCNEADLPPAAESLRTNTVVVNGQMTSAGQEASFDRGNAQGGFGNAQTSVAFRSVASPLPSDYPSNGNPFHYFNGSSYLAKNWQVQYWNTNGYKFFYTVGSSDLTQAWKINGGTDLPLFVPKCAGDAALRMANNRGLYIHEVVTVLAYPEGNPEAPWDYDAGVDRLSQSSGVFPPHAVNEANARWESLDHWVMLAKALNKKVIWSEPGEAWRALAQDETANEYFAKWGDTLVPMFATNFESPTSGRWMGYSRQWASRVAERYGMPLGASVQSWYFREQTDLGRQMAEGLPTDAVWQTPGVHTGIGIDEDTGAALNPGVCCVMDPINNNSYFSQGAYYSFPTRGILTNKQPSLPPTETNTQELARYGRAYGATFYQVEGTNSKYTVAAHPPGEGNENHGPVNDMAYGSSYLNGVKKFSTEDLSAGASAKTEIKTKPLYQLWSPGRISHYYTIDNDDGVPLDPAGSRAAKCIPTPDPYAYCYYEYYGKPEVTGYVATSQTSGSVALKLYRNQADGFYYLRDGDPTHGIPSGYSYVRTLGYVMPTQAPGTQPWYWMWSQGRRTGLLDYFYTTDPSYQRPGALISDWYEYKDIGIAAWLFTHAPIDDTPPAITLSGGLYNQRNAYVGEGSYSLQIKTTDGTLSGGDQDRGSGVKRVDVYVNGTEDFSTGDVPCTAVGGSCKRTDIWTLDTTEWPPGDLEVTVKATDQAGNSASQSLTVSTDIGHEPLEFGGESLDEPDDVSASAASHAVTWGIAAEPARAAFFSSDLFKSLDVSTVRTSVEFNVVTKALGYPPAGTDPGAFYDLRYKPAPPPVGATPQDRRNSPGNQLRRVDNWLKKACPYDLHTGQHKCTYQPLVSFRFDRGNPNDLPDPDTYERHVLAFLKRYPFVKLYTPWNEPNADNYQPQSAYNPSRIAKYYLRLAQLCDTEGCTVGAGNFRLDEKLTNEKHGWPMQWAGTEWVDNPSVPANQRKTYLGAFRTEVLATRRPAAWSVNDYRSGNYRNPTQLKRFVILTQDDINAPVNSPGPNIWMVEQGGLYVLQGVTYRTPTNTGLDGVARWVRGRATRAVRYYVGNPDSGDKGVVNMFPRISRFYLYSWRGDKTGTQRVDSGLMTLDGSGQPRTEFYCYRYKTNSQSGDRDRCDPENPENADEATSIGPP